MSTTAERHEFQAEVRALLDLLVHSLYSHKEIFLRELISNASDALDKLRFESLTNPALSSDEELHIRITRDAEDRTLSVSDNGIGMSHQDLIDHLGTLARSGTMDFLKAVQQSKDQAGALELIGQFGVGFYSSFMVAERVTVVTRRAGEDAAWKWESTGDGAFTIEPTERVSHGTTVMLHLRDVDEEDGIQDYTAEWVIKEIVKRHSDFVTYPIKMEVARQEGGEGGAEPTTTVTDETLNSMQAIWLRPKDEVTDEEYNEFYKHITHDWTDPQSRISVHMEGAVEARALLYIPSRAPFDLYHREMSYRGLQLYIRRVFIMDECRDLMPTHLRFIKGVVDSDDLSLNVSREMLQQDRKIGAIRKFLVRKVMDELKRIRQNDRSAYAKLWTQFGPVLKEGLLTFDDTREAILDLVLAPSTRDDAETTTLDEYVARMPEHQPAIYYLTGSDIGTARRSPQLEAFVDKGYEVLLFTDRVDEVWLQNPPAYREKTWQSVSRGEAGLGSDEEQSAAKKELEDRAKNFAGLTTLLQELLGDDVKEVRITNRLTSSPACLVGETHDMSPLMIAMLKEAGQEVPRVKRILELNPAHPIVEGLQARFEADRRDPIVRDAADLLYGQALLAEGALPPDPAGFSRRLAEWMGRVLGE